MEQTIQFSLASLQSIAIVGFLGQILATNEHHVKEPDLQCCEADGVEGIRRGSPDHPWEQAAARSMD